MKHLTRLSMLLLIDAYKVPLRAGLWLAILAVISLSGLVYTTASAADATVSWTLPTKRSDGSTLAADKIARTEIAYGKCVSGALPATPVTVSFPAPATTGVIANLSYGTWCFAARVADTAGNLSVWTPTVTKTYVAPPEPPTLLTVEKIAYELRWVGDGNLRFVAVGTVPLGAPCGTPLIGRYTAFAGATLTKPTTGGIIAARCAAA